MEKLFGSHVHIFVKHNSKFLELGSKNTESNFCLTETNKDSAVLDEEVSVAVIWEHDLLGQTAKYKYALQQVTIPRVVQST